MKHISQIIEQLKNVDVSVKCRRCGAMPMVTGKQYTVRCPKCGMIIRITQSYLATLKLKESMKRYGKTQVQEKYNCKLCRDNGFVIIEQQIDDSVGTYGYRCLCAAGQNRIELSGWPLLPIEKPKMLVRSEV